MKKLLTLLSVCLICAGASASEAEIRQVFDNIKKHTLDFRMLPVVQYYTPDAVCHSADGRKFDYQTLKKFARASDMVAHSDASFSEIMAAAYELRGKSVTPEQLAQFKELEKSEIGQTLLTQFRSAAKKNLAQMKPKVQAVVDSFTFKSIQITGDKATVIYCEKDLMSGKLKEIICSMVKRNGKWMISGETGRFIGK